MKTFEEIKAQDTYFYPRTSCEHGVQVYAHCFKCKEKQARERLEDEWRQTLIDATTAFRLHAGVYDKTRDDI
jgi:hypothetical protein